MTKRHQAKLVHEGDHVAEVELVESVTGWSP